MFHAVGLKAMDNTESHKDGCDQSITEASWMDMAVFVDHRPRTSVICTEAIRWQSGTLRTSVDATRQERCTCPRLQ